MTCPHCRLLNHPSAQRCDCGWDFTTRTFQTPYAPPRRYDSSTLQWLGCLGTLLLTTSAVAAGAVQVSLFGLSQGTPMFTPLLGWLWTVPVALLIRKRWPDVAYGMAVAGAALFVLSLPLWVWVAWWWLWRL